MDFTVQGKRYKTLESALDDVEKENRSAEIVIIPPEPDYETDKDEIDEDDLQTITLPKDIPGEVEVFLSDNDFDSEDRIPLAVLCNIKTQQGPSKSKKQRITGRTPEWTKEVVDIDMTYDDNYKNRENNMKKELANLNPIEVFEKIFNEEIINYLVLETNQYAQQKNCHSFVVSNDEMKIFLAILLFSGYHHLPREKLYWSLDEDMNCTIITNAMSRNRYYEIKKYFHLANNEQIDKQDKMFKVRPLMERLNKNFLQWGIFHKELSIDEAMVKYFGHHSSKQAIRGKPIRFGFKDWMLCSSTGYCYKFDTYCGAKQDNESSNLPLGSRVILDLVKVIEEPSNHVLFFDNFFTSHSLLVQLKEQGFKATGTIRDNRTNKCPLPSPKEMKGKSRSHFDYQYDKANSLLFVRWKDNNIVTMATNNDSIEPLGKVKRWSKEKKAKIDVSQPHLFASYNKGMGGVDLLDQGVNNYRITIQGKKWWWSLWTHMLNVSVVNAWKLHSVVNKQSIDQLDFLRTIVRNYLRNFAKSTCTKMRKPSSVPKGLSQTGFGHFPQKLENPLRCKVCHQRVRWKCIKCNATLCLERNCFIKFHQ